MNQESSEHIDSYLSPSTNEIELDESESREKELTEIKTEPIWKWFIGVIGLAAISLTTGTPNLYPSQFDNIQQALGISNSVATFMLTGGVMLLYITLPTGIFMDKYGTNITFLISLLITVISYIVLPFTSSIPGLFIFFYLVMAFGSSSLFIVNLEIAFSRSPPKIKGFSGSIVSASLSLSFGLFLEIYKAGKNGLKCNGYECVFSSFQMVAIVVIVVLVVISPISFFFFRQFPAPHFEASSRPEKSYKVFLQFKFYILILSMFLCVFDGLMIVSAGSILWPMYGKGYPNGASDYGIAFSATNCVFTIILSAILDFFIHKLGKGRSTVFGVFWICLGIFPLINAIIFKSTDNEALFAVFSSTQGIPFGFGLAQIPATVSDFFGNELFGFVFGFIQIGSIAASACTLPVAQQMNPTDVMITFFICAAAHLLLGVSLVLLPKCDKPNKRLEELDTNSTSQQV